MSIAKATTGMAILIVQWFYTSAVCGQDSGLFLAAHRTHLAYVSTTSWFSPTRILQVDYHDGSMRDFTLTVHNVVANSKHPLTKLTRVIKRSGLSDFEIFASQDCILWTDVKRTSGFGARWNGAMMFRWKPHGFSHLKWSASGKEWFEFVALNGSLTDIYCHNVAQPSLLLHRHVKESNPILNIKAFGFDQAALIQNALATAIVDRRDHLILDVTWLGVARPMPSIELLDVDLTDPNQRAFTRRVKAPLSDRLDMLAISPDGSELAWMYRAVVSAGGDPSTEKDRQFDPQKDQRVLLRITDSRKGDVVRAGEATVRGFAALSPSIWLMGWFENSRNLWFVRPGQQNPFTLTVR